jgi:hypothetical protein
MGGQLLQLFVFVHSFYGLRIPLYFNHHSSSKALFVIFSYVSTHQDNPLARPFFALAHFYTLHFSLKFFPSCIFPYLVDDTHILDLTHVVSLAFDHFDS